MYDSQLRDVDLKLYNPSKTAVSQIVQLESSQLCQCCLSILIRTGELLAESR